MGLAAVAIAVVGAVVLARRRRRADTIFFAVVALANLVGAVFVSGLEHDKGIIDGLVVGGFLIDLVVVIGVLVALGATAIGDAVAAGRTRGRPPGVGKLSAGLRTAAVAVCAVIVLVPSLVVHVPYATHRGPALADNYGRRVLESLPPNAVLVVWGYEYAEPIRYRQIVHGERRDVAVFSGAESPYRWYREELRRELPTIAPAVGLPDNQYVLDFLAAARGSGRCSSTCRRSARSRAASGSASTASWPR